MSILRSGGIELRHSLYEKEVAWNQEVEVKTKVFETLKWFFRSQLLVATASALLFFSSFEKITEAQHDSGPYHVAYGEDGENVKQVSRNEFMRHEAGELFLTMFFAVFFWGLAAYSLHQSDAEQKEEIRILKWKLSELEQLVRDGASEK